MMNSIITEGYSLVAVGEHYINEAADVVQTLRKFDDNRPVSLISHAENSECALNCRYLFTFRGKFQCSWSFSTGTILIV